MKNSVGVKAAGANMKNAVVTGSFLFHRVDKALQGNVYGKKHVREEHS